MIMKPVVRNQNWLPSLFDDFFGDRWIESHQFASPAVNIIENEKSFDIEVAAPGMTKDDFKINLSPDNELTISLEKKSENEEKSEKKGTYLRRDFAYTSFKQSFILPDEVDESKIQAKMEHGVLHIEMPKKEVTVQKNQERQIEIC